MGYIVADHEKILMEIKMLWERIKWELMRIRDIQQFLSKFTDGQKGTSVSDCQVFIEMQDGTLAEIKKMELQESRIIGKMNGAAWRVVMKGDKDTQRPQSLTFKI